MSSIRLRALGDENAERRGTNDSPYLAHLYVVQSDESWCPAPCQGATWELAAPKPELDSKYALYEAAIWRQERRATLYQFDPAWQWRARHAYHEVCFGEGWDCYNYRVFRENRTLLSVGPWPVSADKNAGELSTFLLGAFSSFFSTIREKAPKAQHIAVTYSGHGAFADGSLFEGSLHKGDATSLLHSVTRSTGQLAMLNFGGNCAEGRWNMVAHLHYFADWIIASDLKVGGVELNKEENTMETVRARERLSDVSVIKEVAEAEMSVRSMVERIVQAREEIWKTVWKGPILRQNLRQSIAAYHSSDFKPFEAALRAAYMALPMNYRKDFESHVEAAECDVLEAARFLEAKVPGNAAKGLEASFKAMRQIFASTSQLVQWDTVLHGLGFNFNGWNEPPCDLVTALGPGAPPPPGGWNGGGTPMPMDVR